MARFNSPLDRVHIAAPCTADWDQMIGNDRARFCGQCNLNVYNLSSMSKAEAESFIAGNEGRLCVRFYRRADGSILTNNCPVGLRAIRRRMSSFAKAISSAALSFFAGVGAYGLVSNAAPFESSRTMGELVLEAPSPPALPTIPARNDEGLHFMGRMSVRRSIGFTPNVATHAGRKTTRRTSKPKTESTR
jgi:hypothetical protein